MCTQLVVWSLCLVGLSSTTFAGEPEVSSPPASAAAPASIEQVQQVVDRAIGYVRGESAAWLNTRKCAACHHVPMAVWSLSEARRQGYAIDEPFVAETMENTLGSPEKMIAAGLFPNPNGPPDTRPLASGVQVGTAFMAVAARSLPSVSEGQQQSLNKIAEHLVEKLRADGSWEFFLSRPPINENETSDAVWLILALQGEAGPDAPAARQEALAKALAWYDAANLPDTQQDRVFKLLLAVRAGKPREVLEPLIAELLARQHADGGWSQLATLPSDAYATGQTLYVLALAGSTLEQEPIRKAVEFLVSTQQPDGSWLMTSRSSPDGKPGGSSKLLTPITCAASSWAVLGLSHLAPRQ